MVFEEWSPVSLSKGLWLVNNACQLVDSILNRLVDLIPSWLTGYLRWCPTSVEQLEEAEKSLLQYVKKKYHTWRVPIEHVHGCSGQQHIWTLKMDPSDTDDKEKLPLVMVHGFASGLALWLLNMEELSKDRKLYCFDVLGFGRSSRPAFLTDALNVERQFVESIESWRKAVGLERFVLLGHSMGGFLAAAYALQHPEPVAHLILADPWGFPERHLPSNKTLQLPTWVRAVSTLLRPFNPLSGLRAAGPLGPRLIEKVRPDIQKKYEHIIQNPALVSNYIYHCNAQNPSGEAAFKAMTTQFGWAKHPMVNRIPALHEGVPITFIYGSRSWIDKQPGIQVQRLREESFVEIEVIDGAGHHVYADKADLFNELIRSICQSVDDNENVSRSSSARRNTPEAKSPRVLDLETEEGLPASISFASDNPW